MHYPTFDRDHFADIAKYENDVLSGERPACQWERLAVERHIKDFIAANDSPDSEYYFDFKEALRPIHFIECFPHVKDRWSKGLLYERLIALEGWQKWIIAQIFGWRKRKNGHRRFSLAYVCVPRKNGKSVLAAGISLFMLAADDEAGAEVYCGATNQQQAWEVFKPAKKMVEDQQAFCEKYGFEVHAQKLYRPGDLSIMKPIIGKPGDGSSPSFWVADEYHEHPDDTLIDTMAGGQGARSQGLGLIITTAGDNHEGPCFAQEEEVKQILTGAANDDSTFGIVYTIDKDVDWKSEKALVMANPNYGVSVDPDKLKDEQQRAINNPRKQAHFKNKKLCVWVSAKEGWLNPEDWMKAANDEYTLDHFKGQPCGLGADLSESKDLTALVKCFEKQINGKTHYFFFGRYYTTERQKEEIVRYAEWVHKGYLTACEGSMIDYELVKEDLEEDNENFLIDQCFYDPKGAAVVSQQVENDLDISAVRFEQSYTNFSPIMKDFEALLLDGRIHHDANPCFTWMVENIVAKKTMDGKDFRPVKASDKKKIDGGVAMLMSFASVYNPEKEETYDSIYNYSDLS